MAARVGVSRDDVVHAAIGLIEGAEHSGELSLGAVARVLGIRPQSLYAHVDGVAGLNRAVAVAGLRALEAEVAPAAIGRSGPDAVESIVRAHLDFARRRPRLYLASLHPPGEDRDLTAAIDAVARPLDIVLTSLGMDHTERVHWTRLFLASVSGFVTLVRDDRLSVPVDVDDTAHRLVDMLVSRLPATTALRGPGAVG